MIRRSYYTADAAYAADVVAYAVAVNAVYVVAVNADAAYTNAYTANAYRVTRNLIHEHRAAATKRWSTEDKAEVAGRYLYMLAKLELI